ARTRDGPGARAFRVLPRVPRPAMSDDIEMKARRKSHVGFERERLLLLTPAAQCPLYRKRPRQQANGQARILKPARGKMQGCLQPRTAALPAQIVQPALAQTRPLHPAQHAARPAPVVPHKPAVPDTAKRQRCQYVDEDKADQGVAAPADRSYF